MFYNSQGKATQAKALIESSYQITDTASVIKPPLIHRGINHPGDTN
jgi:hypothetical protein